MPGAAFVELFARLVRYQDKVAGWWDSYNDAVRIAAARCGTFPHRLVARYFRWELPTQLHWSPGA